MNIKGVLYILLPLSSLVNGIANLKMIGKFVWRLPSLFCKMKKTTSESANIPAPPFKPLLQGNKSPPQFRGPLPRP